MDVHPLLGPFLTTRPFFSSPTLHQELNDALFLLRRAKALLEARAARLKHEHHHAHPLRWRDITAGSKFRFFNFWQILLLLGSAIALYESAVAVKGFRVRFFVLFFLLVG